jgi:MinD superfamily P-loop ATPase
MVELVVLSGKGGTGKTSLVGSLAALAGGKILVDCDVDAADLHMILDTKTGQANDFSAEKKASIDGSKCIACGICVDYCRFDAIKSRVDEQSQFGEVFWIDEYSCEGCGVCRHFCSEEAIDFREVVNGTWTVSETKYGTLVHASLGIAEGTSGKLVSLLRKTAQSVAGTEGQELIIIDGPPGIGCPVIAALTGTDYVLIVTEPSQSAFHDLDRILRLTMHFDIPSGLCINKFDINTEFSSRIEAYAREKNIPVLARFPYDPCVTEAQLAGVPFVEYTDGEMAEQVRLLWLNLLDEIKDISNKKAKSHLTDLPAGNLKNGRPL